MGKSGGNGRGGGGGGGGRGGYKSKSKAKMYYLKQAKTKNRGGPRGTSGGDGGGGKFTKLAVGMRGFLCTTNYNEKNAVKEAYNLLNEYHDEKDDVDEDVESTALYSSQEDSMSGQCNLEEGGAPGLEEDDNQDDDRSLQEGQTAKPEEKILKPVDDSGQTSAPPVKKPRMESDDEDVESALAAEITLLKSSKVKFKFQSVDTGVRNLIFINTTVKSPVKLAHQILEDLSEKKVQKSRYLLRMLPVEAVCRAEISDIKKTAESLFPKYFKTGFNSFQVVYKSRYNDSLDRTEVIRVLANAVMEINTFNMVNLNDSKFSIIVEIFRNMCCLGVVTDFNKFRKYNLLEAASEKGQGNQSTDKEAVGSAAEDSSGTSAVPETTETSQDSSSDQIKTDD